MSAKELLERLEGGEIGGKIDAEIIALLAAPEDAVVEQSPFNGAWCIYQGLERNGSPRLWNMGREWSRQGGWNVSTSLDAAVALVERVLPEGTWSLDHHRKEPCYAGVRKDDWTPPTHAYAPTPAATLIAALLRSVEG